jgi:integrase
MMSVCVQHGKLLPSPGSGGILAPAETRWVTENREETVARPRWQTGWIFQRGKRNPVWIGRYREDVLADGRRQRRQRSIVLGPVRAVGKRKAEALLAERLVAINKGTRKPTVMITFEQFVVERFGPNIFPMLRPGTARNYQSLIRHDLLPFFGEMRLPEIGAADVQMFLAGKAKQLAAGTVLTLRNRLSKIFGTAQKWGYLQSNPAQGAQVPGQTEMRERIALSPQQVKGLLAELSEPFRNMVLLAVLSGLRRGELFALRWKHVDLVDRSIVVAESIYLGRTATPKTKASRRKVFLDGVVLDSLACLRPKQVQPDDFVFHSERGTPLNPYNVLNRVIRPACKRAGLPPISWHAFRYTYSTWADPTGESIKALQAQLGHNDSKLTLSVYTQPMPAAQRQVAAKVADVLHRVLLPVAPKFERDGDGGERKKTLIQ